MNGIARLRKVTTTAAVLATASLLGLLVGALTAPVASARAQVDAKVTYEEDGEGLISNVLLHIYRDGAKALELPPINPCEGCTLVPVSPDFQKPARVVQLDASPEPEVLFTLSSGGAHCCAYTEVFRWDEASGRYLLSVHEFPEIGYRLRYLRGDGPPLFVGVDGRLAGRFSCSVCGGVPPQVWEYRRGKFLDVTRSYPSVVKRELAQMTKAYRRTRGKGDVRGILSALVADKCLLGNCKSGFQVVRRAIRAGYVRPFERFESGPHGNDYLRALRRVLTGLGYVRPGAGASAAAASPGSADVQRGLQGLVAARGGPPGAIATMYRDGRMTILRAGRANVQRRGAPRPTEHMRIASVAKAFSGAVALNLVQAGRLGLDDTIGQRLGGMPSAWGPVTVRQLLNHTSGLPDYTQSKGFAEQASKDPRGYVSPSKIIDWVRSQPLEFAPGSRYEYSNTDNIVIGLIAQAVTGESYGKNLEEIVFGPANLRATSFPARPALPKPFIHGYVTEVGEPPADVSTALSPSGAWASGAIVSTPRDLNVFIRSYLGLRFFSATQQQEQMRFVPGGESSPPGPGHNSAGLALFRYKTKCGTVYGHTGNFPGYVQWAAATADGSRAVTTSLNIPAPTGKLLAQLRRVQTTAVCALLAK